MKKQYGKLETIVVVDEYGCVESVEFVHRDYGDKITIIRKEEKEES